jgi:hypothetical protein
MNTEFYLTQLKSNKKLSFLKLIWIFPIGVLLIAGFLKIFSPSIMTESFAQFDLENPVRFITFIGLLEVTLVISFLIPYTREVGFLFLTAFIGGIIATELLGGSVPIIPVLLQTVLWAGYFFEKKELNKKIRN